MNFKWKHWAMKTFNFSHKILSRWLVDWSTNGTIDERVKMCSVKMMNAFASKSNIQFDAKIFDYGRVLSPNEEEDEEEEEDEKKFDWLQFVEEMAEFIRMRNCLLEYAQLIRCHLFPDRMTLIRFVSFIIRMWQHEHGRRFHRQFVPQQAVISSQSHVLWLSESSWKSLLDSEWKSFKKRKKSEQRERRRRRRRRKKQSKIIAFTSKRQQFRTFQFGEMKRDMIAWEHVWFFIA